MTFISIPGVSGDGEDDFVSQILRENDISSETVDEVRDVLISFLASRDPEVPLYLVPQSDAGVLTGPQLAGEIVDRGELGDSFVDLFMAGALLRGPHALEEAVESIRYSSKEP